MRLWRNLMFWWQFILKYNQMTMCGIVALTLYWDTTCIYLPLVNTAMSSQNNLTYRQILRYFCDRAESEILPHNENSTISRLGVQISWTTAMANPF